MTTSFASKLGMHKGRSDFSRAACGPYSGRPATTWTYPGVCRKTNSVGSPPPQATSAAVAAPVCLPLWKNFSRALQRSLTECWRLRSDYRSPPADRPSLRRSLLYGILYYYVLNTPLPSLNPLQASGVPQGCTTSIHLCERSNRAKLKSPLIRRSEGKCDLVLTQSDKHLFSLDILAPVLSSWTASIMR